MNKIKEMFLVTECKRGERKAREGLDWTWPILADYEDGVGKGDS